MRKLTLIVALMLLSMPAWAQTALTFQWDAHPEAATITGFKLYQAKQSGNYTTPVAVFTGGTLTTGQCPKPSSPGRYYWVLRAFMPDPATPGVDIESGNSNEVTDVIKPKEPTGFIKTVGAAIAYVPRKVGGVIKSLFVDSNLKLVQ